MAALRDESRAIIGIGAAIGATGVLIALASDVMGAWALPVFAIPLLVTQFSFRRYAAIRATYLQTIRALSRVTEVGGYTEAGHARRVSQLSLAVGRELGLTEVALQDLEYAALMHDIGQLSLADPIPGGATVVAAPDEQRRIAEMGAQIVRQTGVLDHVALIVERQAEPYRRPGEQVDPSVPMQSRIIRAVNAYDDLVGGSLETERRLQGLERLRLGMAYDYDPRIVETLTRVVERTTLLSV
jgi:response regulator RpfG family c-di-GMP phosphodiesterase